MKTSGFVHKNLMSLILAQSFFMLVNNGVSLEFLVTDEITLADVILTAVTYPM